MFCYHHISNEMFELCQQNQNTKGLLIKLMIINTNRTEEQQLTIDYIRHLTHTLKSSTVLQSSDSLAFSRSESDGLNNVVSKKEKKKKKKQKQKQQSTKSYVSPYKQYDLSMKKIMTSRKKNQFPQLIQSQIFNSAPQEKRKVSKNPRKRTSPPRYRARPTLLQKFNKSQVVDQMKTEAREAYRKNEADKMELTKRQKNEKWAQFLLRERRWESGKQDKRRMAEQKIIAQQKEQQRNSFTARQYPRMKVEEHIRSVNRKKTKLKEELKSHLLNYYTYETPVSPIKQKPRQVLNSYSRDKSPVGIHSRLTSKDKKIHLHTKRQIDFLVNQGGRA